MNSFSRKDIPIIITAFGTTTSAFSTYEKMDAVFKTGFPDNPVYWAWSSRMVTASLKKAENKILKDPVTLMSELAASGHEWAVLQSLHLICGHEFDRLVSGERPEGFRTSMGLPLLTSADDYIAAAKAVARFVPMEQDMAAVFVGHGTDHPAWTSYPAFESVLRRLYGDSVFTGVVEGYPDMDITLERVVKAGFKKVRLVPFMLVAGTHFREDLTGGPDSWQKTFESRGIAVEVTDHGMGHINMITKIYCSHIRDALDIIPLQD